jgi:hypothetical protein
MIRPTYAQSAWYLGLDLGQRIDYTALAVIELIWTHIGRDGVTFEEVFQPSLNLCGLRRFPLGTAYASYPPIVARRINQIRGKASPYADVTLAVDAGGPGLPVIEELRRARLGVSLQPMFITSGNAPGRAKGGIRTVPRRELLANLVLLLDHKVLRWPARLPERAAWERELLDLSAGTTHPERTTGHDDLVMAVAIAVWHAAERTPKLLTRERRANDALWSPFDGVYW